MAVFEAHGLRTPALAGRTLFAWEHLALGAGLHLVLGDEGRGKTLLLRTLAGEFAPALERATLAGNDLHTAPEAFAREVAHFDPDAGRTADTTVDALFATLARRYPHWSADSLDALVDALALQAHRHKTLAMLSTGSRRKVWTVAALASGAALTLLDMPFAALDANAVRTLHEVLADCASHPRRAFVVADYAAPAGVCPRTTLDLDQSPRSASAHLETPPP